MSIIEDFPPTSELDIVERGATLTDQAYARLRLHLLAGTFLPGERISIRKLAEKMQISFTPAREALSRLAVEGAVTISAMRNVCVAQLRFEEVDELYMIREHLEGLAAAHAAPLISTQRLNVLNKIHRKMGKALDRGDYRCALQCNYSLHFGIYRASGFAEVVRLIEGVWLKIGPSLHLLYPTYQVTRRGIEHHAEMLEGISAKDSRATRAAVIADIRDGRDEIKRALKSTQTSSKAPIKPRLHAE
jgi:DNA-binding GntR family transcriptional regulator